MGKRLRQAKSQAFTVTSEMQDEVAHLLSESQGLRDLPALADRGKILMSRTALSNALVCQPQHRNMHNRIFGGFLMRRAFELAFTTTYLFAGAKPLFIECDEVAFKAPVDVGDLLKLESVVLYTTDAQVASVHTRHTTVIPPLVHVEVVANVVEVDERKSKVSNTFNFTFSIPGKEHVLRVLPANFDEARRVVMRMEADRVQM